jgi:hypothetical protein
MTGGTLVCATGCSDSFGGGTARLAISGEGGAAIEA